jgi:hypothetical protein
LKTRIKPRQAVITLELFFDLDQITYGKAEHQVRQAIALINSTLQREPYGLAAQLGEEWSGLIIHDTEEE